MSTTNGTIDREMVVEALAHFREQWEAGIDGSLVDVEASVGLLLMDISLLLGLNTAEQATVLGRELRREVFATLRAR